MKTHAIILHLHAFNSTFMYKTISLGLSKYLAHPLGAFSIFNVEAEVRMWIILADIKINLCQVYLS